MISTLGTKGSGSKCLGTHPLAAMAMAVVGAMTMLAVAMAMVGEAIGLGERRWAAVAKGMALGAASGLAPGRGWG